MEKNIGGYMSLQGNVEPQQLCVTLKGVEHCSSWDYVSDWITYLTQVRVT